MSVTHLTGPVINVGGRAIQRCSICGEKLLDSKNCMAPIPAGKSEPDPFPTWEAGRLLRVEGENPTYSSLLDDSDDHKLPDDSCIDLVEE